ncbi:NADPH-dependent F420 reductase [Neorhizobium sp. DAR64860/K0K1]|uniref:NADPH-dependent F420 reductase n=1 Tax=Neorhizobium sp. DAR64860/K0K1 TaxID=3421955 RepID=UPI003D2DFBA8
MSKSIAILGSGMIGGQTARLVAAAGLEVVVANTRGPDSLRELVAELGPTARAASAEEAIQAADIVVVAIPFQAYSKLSPDLLAGKIVIDTMNYYPERDGHMPEVQTDVLSTSELVQRHLAKSQVVRAFNNLDFVRLRRLARPAGSTDRSAVPIAGDDVTAKTAVANLLDVIGYDSVDMGPLAESWRSEPTTPIYVVPFVGNVPDTVASRDDVMNWYMNTPGYTVTKAEVEGLVAKAERHDRMFGDLDQFKIKELFGPA